MNDTASKKPGGAFTHKTFTVLWVAALVSNIGTWMHSVGATWLMTDYAPSPLMVSLVQTATTLPVFFLALPAGALADIFDKRRLLILINLFMGLAAAAFAALVWGGLGNATLLLIFTFLLGCGAALMAPAWQAIIPKLVPKEDLPEAVALGGISINLSRAVGPALAGLMIGVWGVASPFMVNALSFVGIIAAVLWWRSQKNVQNDALPPERVMTAMLIGLRHARHNKPLKNTMWHIAGFMFFANAFWGLLPLVARESLGGDATFFGLVMSAIGLGAVGGGVLLPRLKKHLSALQLVTVGTVGTSVISATIALMPGQYVALLACLIFGISWILVLATINLSGQQALPDWVRARGLAIMMMAFFGAMSAGAAFWGWIAGIYGVIPSLVCAGIGGVLFILISQKRALQMGADMNFTPSHHWAEPTAHDSADTDSGMVMITVEYEIADDDRDTFLSLISQMKHARYRGGAFGWKVFENAEQKGRFIEVFYEESWAAHQRHHDRVTEEDHRLEGPVRALHQGDPKLTVTHLIQAPTK